ncbi:LOW QUALITY PROTEIN: mitochondrial import inner membrane translocase subunit TIM50-like, partial [Spheniscus humboldti]
PGCPWLSSDLPSCPQVSLAVPRPLGHSQGSPLVPRAHRPPRRVPPIPQAAEGPLGRTPSPEEEEEEERRRRERMAAARRLALRLAGLLGTGTGVALIYIFGSNAVDEHGAKIPDEFDGGE